MTEDEKQKMAEILRIAKGYLAGEKKKAVETVTSILRWESPATKRESKRISESGASKSMVPPRDVGLAAREFRQNPSGGNEEPCELSH